MERSHRELRSRFPDRLSGDDADRFAESYDIAGRQVEAIAFGADPSPAFTGKGRTDADCFNTGVINRLCLEVREDITGAGEHFCAIARQVDIVENGAAVDAVFDREEFFISLFDRAHFNSIERPAIIARNDHVLRHVDKAAGQVSRVGRFQSRVGETFARSVRRDEVLHHRQSLAEVGRNGRFDDLAGWLRHQTAERSELFNLRFVAASARIYHEIERVELARRGIVDQLEQIFREFI